ncbi:unnamed protein product, partial [marine sediment metagenome]
KHKSTEKIVALNRSRLAKLKRELEQQVKRLKSAKKIVSPFSIKKEGIQIILISDYQTPGVGKTSLLNFLTGAAKGKIGKFTPTPEIGILEYNKIRFQIVDMPSIMEGAAKGVGNGKEILSQIRACDLLCICIDLARNFKNQMEGILRELKEADIRINTPPPPINIEKTGSNKIQVLYITQEARDNEEMEELTDKIKEVVSESGIRNAIVKIHGSIYLEQVVDTLTPSIVYKKVMILGTKGDLPHTETAYDNLKNQYSSQFPLIIG